MISIHMKFLSVKFRQRFPSSSSDFDPKVTGSGQRSSGGNGALQIEIHNGASPIAPLSPDVSPIAFHAAGKELFFFFCLFKNCSFHLLK